MAGEVTDWYTAAKKEANRIYNLLFGRSPTESEVQSFLNTYDKEKEMIFDDMVANGTYVVVNQWDDGKMLVSLVRADSPIKAASAKQAHLDRTSRQRDNRVVAVSRDPVPSVPENLPKDHSAWAATPLMAVTFETVPPPPPPKTLKVKANYFRASGLSRSAPSTASTRSSPYEDWEHGMY